MGDAVVIVDVEPRDGGGSIVARPRPVDQCDATPARLARILAARTPSSCWAGSGRRRRGRRRACDPRGDDDGRRRGAGVGLGRRMGGASSFAPRLRALVTDAVPVPPPPQTPAARLRDAEDHVALTTRRVRQHLDARYGGFDHHPDWGFHGAFGSARVFVEVLPVLDDSTAVRVSSPVLSQVAMSDELALRLLSLAAEQPFGRVRLPGRA